MFGSLWTRLRPAALMVTLGLCFLASVPSTGFSQEPAVESVAAPSEAAAPPVLSFVLTHISMSVLCPGFICRA